MSSQEKERLSKTTAMVNAGTALGIMIVEQMLEQALKSNPNMTIPQFQTLLKRYKERAENGDLPNALN